MKNKIILAILFTPLFIGCSNDSDEAQTIPQESTPLLITASQNKATSRVAFANDGAVVNWTSEDKFSVFGASEKQVFTLVEGADTPKGIFKGDQFTGGGPYQAFYPEAEEKDTYDACILDATGQKQARNDDMAHLANYTYMTGNVTLGAEGEARVGFSHQMVMMKFVLTLPTLANDEVLKKLIISTNKTNKENVIYLKKGLVDNSLDEKSEEQELDITEITPDGNTLTAYMMMVPFSLDADDKLILTVETELPAGADDREDDRNDDNDEFYRARFYDKIVTMGAAKTYEAGKKYTAEVNLAPVAYKRADESYSYPVKVTNTTTKKSYYVVSPFADWLGGVTINEPDIYMKSEWKMLDSNLGVVPTYITIQEIVNAILSNSIIAVTADLRGFYEAFPHNGEVYGNGFWLYSYDANRLASRQRFVSAYSGSSCRMALSAIDGGSWIVRLVRQ